MSTSHDIPSLRSPDCWGDDDQTVLVCSAVATVTHDVKNFVFEHQDDRVFQFEPGQYLTLMLDIDGHKMNRCYTISSPPTRPHRVAITVKRVNDGSVSNWLHDNVVPGFKIAAMAPLGAFTLARGADDGPRALGGNRRFGEVAVVFDVDDQAVDGPAGRPYDSRR